MITTTRRDNDKDYCGDEVMMRRTRAMTGTDEDEDKENYCCHKVMMMRRRRRRRTTTTRRDDNKDCCGNEGKMMRRTTETRIRTLAFIWFPSREKRKVYWYYCHSYNTLFITLDMDY